MARQNVLVVDDDAALAENVAEIIGALDVDVEMAGSARQALAAAGGKRFDLVLVDVRLPDADGTEVVAPLRATGPHTEVVLITGDASIDSAIAAVRGGAFAFVLKPFSPPELLDIARRALARAALAAEHERLQQELQRSESRHRQVVEAVPALVLALDGGGRIALWNRRLEEITGRSREEMIGQPGAELVGAGGVRPLATAGGGERLVRWETAQVPLPGGSAPSDGGGGAGETWTYAVGADVTAEQEMLRRTLRAERLAAVGTLAAGLAHEVRNPLNSAALQLEVLERRLAKGGATPESTLPVAALISEEIRRLERLVSEFLSFARPRPLELQPTALEDLCRDVIAFGAPEAQAAGVTVALEVAPGLPPLAADPERLRQVLRNLVRNGIEAMPDGGRLTVRVRRAGGGVEIDVADTGVGFGDEAPIFDAFFTTKSKGTGLGLSIVHRIVTDHGGTVRVRSRPGDTCFTIALPLTPPA
jgi:signal transduction histidine kinase